MNINAINRAQQDAQFDKAPPDASIDLYTKLAESCLEILTINCCYTDLKLTDIKNLSQQLNDVEKQWRLFAKTVLDASIPDVSTCYQELCRIADLNSQPILLPGRFAPDFPQQRRRPRAAHLNIMSPDDRKAFYPNQAVLYLYDILLKLTQHQPVTRKIADAQFQELDPKQAKALSTIYDVYFRTLYTSDTTTAKKDKLIFPRPINNIAAYILWHTITMLKTVTYDQNTKIAYATRNNQVIPYTHERVQAFFKLLDNILTKQKVSSDAFSIYKKLQNSSDICGILQEAHAFQDDKLMDLKQLAYA